MYKFCLKATRDGRDDDIDDRDDDINDRDDKDDKDDRDDDRKDDGEDDNGIGTDWSDDNKDTLARCLIKLFNEEDILSRVLD
ncbi:uncharacterized protein OCT59_008731 [Rhizophagus irregularis]|uniref:uncharacterized protein n=1 Tax=Rhizophagus irregularis TaxID=588596 RepID=UPI0033221E8A|nr:hypothetical protein OCT59_008731 [Rhizophagus irregularis]